VFIFHRHGTRRGHRDADVQDNLQRSRDNQAVQALTSGIGAVGGLFAGGEKVWWKSGGSDH